MGFTQPDIEALAERLRICRAEGRACAPLTQTHPDITLADAYKISSRNFVRRTAAGDVRSIGRKIGLTSLAVQKQLGVNQPDFGYLTSDMQVANGGTVAAGSLIQGRAEGEVAFVLARDLRGPGITPSDVLAATDYVVACIEIIDSRVQDWKIQIQDTIADNASSALLVLGDVRQHPGQFDLRMAGMTLWRNGEVESTGVGAACLDHPVNAVQWLANTLGELGDTLKAGDIILSGAYGPVAVLNPGDRVEVAISGLGRVSCRYADVTQKAEA